MPLQQTWEDPQILNRPILRAVQLLLPARVNRNNNNNRNSSRRTTITLTHAYAHAFTAMQMINCSVVCAVAWPTTWESIPWSCEYYSWYLQAPCSGCTLSCGSLCLHNLQ